MFLVLYSSTSIIRTPVPIINATIERKNRAKQILFNRFGIVSFFVATDRTPRIGNPILIKIEAYAKIDIPTANTPIFDAPKILAKYVTAQKPRSLLIISALPR